MRQPFTPNKELRQGRYTIAELLARTRSNWGREDWARANSNGKRFPGDNGLSYRTKLTMQRPALGPYGIRFQTTTTDPVEFGRDDKGRFPRKWVQWVQFPRDFASQNVTGMRTFQCYCNCITGDTRVLTTKGWQTMYSLADISQESDPATLPLSIDYIVNGKVHKGTIPYRMGKKPVWKVTLDNGYSFSATKDHRVLVARPYDSNQKAQKLKGYKYKKPLHWVTVGDLHVGSKIAQNHSGDKFQHVDTHSRLYKESYLAGAFYGDGTYNPFSICVASHPEILERLREVDSNLMSAQSPIRFLFNQTGREVLAKFGMVKTERHTVPNNVDTYGFLSGLLDTDGWVHKDNSIVIYGREPLRSLADKLIADGVHGVKFSVVGSRNRKGFETNKGARLQDQFSLRISAQGMRQIRGSVRSVKFDKVIDKLVAQKRINTTKVVSITYAGVQYVYDITVPLVSRFVAESVIVHNCPRFKFYHHYVLHKNGHAPLPNVNRPPVKTNPYQRVGCCKHTVLALLAINKLSRANKIPQALPESKWREIELYWQKIEREGWGGPNTVPAKIKAIAREVNTTGKAPRGTPVTQRADIKDFSAQIVPPKRVY